MFEIITIITVAILVIAAIKGANDLDEHERRMERMKLREETWRKIEKLDN